MPKGLSIPLWQQHQSEEILEVISGLRRGDLAPLAEYLKSGGLPESPPDTVAIPYWIASELTAMIEGVDWSWYKLATVAQKRGRSWSDDLDKDEERWKIGFFVEDNVRRHGLGSYEAALTGAQEAFCVGRDKAAKAVAFVREYLHQTHGSPEHRWTILQAKYSDENG